MTLFTWTYYSASYRQDVTVDCIASDHVAAWARCRKFLNRPGADPTAVFPVGPGEMRNELAAVGE